MSTTEELQARMAQLEADNAAAPGWGAAVGARHEEIRGIQRELRRREGATPAPIATPEEVARPDHWLRAYIAKPRRDRRDLSETELGALLEQVEALSTLKADNERVTRERNTARALLDEGYGVNVSLAIHRTREESAEIIRALTETVGKLREALTNFVQPVLVRFQKDEADGFRSKDRQYVIEMLGKAFERATLSPTEPEAKETTNGRA